MDPRTTYFVLELVQLSRYFSEVELRLMMRVSRDFCFIVRRELERLKTKDKARRVRELLEIQHELARRANLRSALGTDQLARLDETLLEKFLCLNQARIHHGSSGKETSSQEPFWELESWCRNHPARLVCPNHELSNCNVAMFYNRIAPSLFNAPGETVSSFFSLMKTLLLSNPALLQNRGYTGNGGTELSYFPFYTLITTQCFYGSGTSASEIVFVKKNCEFLRFCLLLQEAAQDHFDPVRQMNHLTFLVEQTFTLTTERSCRSTADPETLYYRGEILKLILFLRWQLLQTNSPLSWDHWIGRGNWKFLRPSYVWSRHRSFYLLMILWRDPGVQEELDNVCLLNSEEREGISDPVYQFFSHIPLLRILLGSSDFRDSFLRHCRTRGILFRLIESKNRKGIKLLWKYCGEGCAKLIDEEGNDPLGAICKVRGCSQRIAEFFIRNGCSLEHKNHRGLGFRDVALASRNKRLLRFLEQENYL